MNLTKACHPYTMQAATRLLEGYGTFSWKAFSCVHWVTCDIQTATYGIDMWSLLVTYKEMFLYVQPDGNSFKGVTSVQTTGLNQYPQRSHQAKITKKQLSVCIVTTKNEHTYFQNSNRGRFQGMFGND